MNQSVIRAHELSKRYRLGELEPYDTLRDTIARWARNPLRRGRSLGSGPGVRANAGPDGFVWALRNVSLDIPRGEAVGIIGPNGAGKTTLLRVLSRITEPTAGWAEIHGRVGTLLEVGTGFHPELTGRENVYLNGAILGMTKREINQKLDQILDFAEIDAFVDTPVKRYSDGMRVRLGFAVAAHMEPDILLVDEVLAVGDIAFQRKCVGKMEDVTGEGRTVLFVSHNMAMIQNLCTVAYGLDHGSIMASGDVNDVIAHYLEKYDRPEPIPLSSRQDRKGTGRLRFMGFSISGSLKSSDTVQCGAHAAFEINYEGKPPLQDVHVEMQFMDQFGIPVLVTSTDLGGQDFDEVPPHGTFICRFDKFPLLPGIYHINLYSTTRGVEADRIKNAITIHVVEGDYYGTGRLPGRSDSIVAVPHYWEVGDAEGPNPPSA